MNVLQAILLGIVQGLTEFLPVSSSGHLALASLLLGIELPADEGLIFYTIIQFGTLLAVIGYFWNDIWTITRVTLASLWRPGTWAKPEVRLGVFLALATIPAGLAALLLKDLVAAAFASSRAVAVFMLITAALMALAERAGTRARGLAALTWLDALVIGLFQALALFPGLSRSGATISGGLLRGLDRPAAARFSFLMSIPIMLAATIYEALGISDLSQPDAFLLPLLVGTLAAAVVGYLSIRWLMGFLTRHSTRGFSIYLVIVGLLVFALMP
ncbi:MAG: undecaprenyl-diphosphatase UppP [Anaerolineae bacterium]|nr:MAG: undecaprenyl-diphosphatase UppP [Anaerolineae bacterium]